VSSANRSKPSRHTGEYWTLLDSKSQARITQIDDKSDKPQDAKWHTTGTQEICVAGDKDGVWDRLREAQAHIQRLGDALGRYKCQAIISTDPESIDWDNWAVPLKAAMEAATVGVIGTSDYGEQYRWLDTV
jgi:hypothetical protein